MSAVAIIAAGGSGRRFGGSTPKQFLPLLEKPLIQHTLEAFERAGSIYEIIVVLPREELDRFSSYEKKKMGLRKLRSVVAGGDTRQESVFCGLEAVAPKTTQVAIHDAARCLITPELIDRTVGASVSPWDGAIMALPIPDTVKRVDGEQILDTISRDSLWGMQTPQVFTFPFIRNAYQKAKTERFTATDDAAVAERAGGKIRVVEGSLRNFKVTRPEDFDLAEKFLSAPGANQIRIGQGIDIHPFAERRKLILGGIEIPSPRGLAGHSDADALIHSICDALLGALALGDMGKHFSDKDPQYKGRSSNYFLSKVMELVREGGWTVSNVDTTVVTEEPILAPYIEPMRGALAETMGLAIHQVSIKATRPEKLGTFGRKEGLVALTSLILQR